MLTTHPFSVGVDWNTRYMVEDDSETKSVSADDCRRIPFHGKEDHRYRHVYMVNGNTFRFPNVPHRCECVEVYTTDGWKKITCTHYQFNLLLKLRMAIPYYGFEDGAYHYVYAMNTNTFRWLKLDSCLKVHGMPKYVEVFTYDGWKKIRCVRGEFNILKGLHNAFSTL